MVAVELNSLSYRYGLHWALREVSFSVGSGVSVALLGPNGCGKTTLLKILATRLRPTRGSGTILGFDLKRGATQIRGEVEWLGHEWGLYPSLTAQENLEFSCAIKGIRPGPQRITDVLSKTWLFKWKDKRVATFSSGMRKRLALARILLGGPKLILLDEPHANLDLQGKQFMNEWITIWKKRGVTLLMASHDHAEVLPLCGQALVLGEGRFAYLGDAKKIPPGVAL